MIHFHTLTVREVRKETEDAVSLTFDVPPELKETFRFRAGQNLTIRKTFGDREVRRNYSICSAPHENLLQVAVKKVEGGLFSTWANEALKAGEPLDVMPPSGSFYTELHPGQKKAYVAIAAGSGITPVLSLIKATLHTEPRSTFTLVYGNRTKASILFREAIEALKDRYIDRFRVFHTLSREQTDILLQCGRIDEAKCTQLFPHIIDPGATDAFFICGPDEMIFSVKRFLDSLGVPRSRIHLELFNVPAAKPQTTNAKPQTDPSAVSKVQIKVDGLFYEFDLPYESGSVLDAALQQGADLPYACKGGVCTTCKARLLEGRVHMDVNWGLEPDEVEKGFILTCQSHPRTPRLVVDFDVK
jgi:ring-1,2-phenylacetyl-CoA epoxidase subunit PaaE